MPFGVYIYSYADTTDKVVSEAQHVLRLIQGYNLSFPIYLDMEDKVQAVLSDSERGNIASVFCNIIQNEGYKVGIYANKNWWTNYLTDSAFNNSLWYKWVAQYNSSCTYSGNYTMWQYTSSGYVNGINTNVDINYWYGEYIDVNPVTVNTTVADSITESNATVRGTVSYSGQKPSEVGIYFGTSENGMSKVANDVINHNKNPFDMWYDLNDEAGLYLDSNTKYYWQCYAIVNGKEYKGEIKSFTTLNSSKPIKSIVCNSTVMKSTKKDVSYMLEVDITNLSAEDIKGIVIIVYRDKNGNIIKIHNGDIDIACNSKLTHSDSINGYTTISRADVYVFESLNNLVPISNNLECNFN
ncbi:MAG: GH25 family lysozyme [Hominilimicola sp.]|uniref:GH25 family lysozyme n=1 Tax=Hominilimicola sp. TaxID=3073571 RepID=UPI00399A82C6